MRDYFISKLIEFGFYQKVNKQLISVENGCLKLGQVTASL